LLPEAVARKYVVALGLLDVEPATNFSSRVNAIEIVADPALNYCELDSTALPWALLENSFALVLAAYELPHTENLKTLLLAEAAYASVLLKKQLATNENKSVISALFMFLLKNASELDI